MWKEAKHYLYSTGADDNYGDADLTEFKLAV